MPPADVSRLLSRIANDPGFRDRLAADPEAALAGYDLTDEEARRFREGGAEALALLTFEARGAERPPSKSVQAPPPILSGRPLPEVIFLLSVAPTVQPGPDGTPQIAHVAGLHTPDTPRDQLSGVLFRLRIAPLATPRDDGATEVRYTTAIEPLSAEFDPTLRPDTAVPTAPWDHDTDSPAVKAAAEAVLQADPEGRSAALRDLIAQVTRGMS